MTAAQAHHVSGKSLARLVFFSFLVTFVAARVLVFLVMSHRVPDLYLHVGGTHVHHMNYGIFLLSAVGASLLFARPADRGLRVAAVAYAVGLALTFDESGMWLHLGGGYWQRASWDAVAVIAAALGVVGFFPGRGGGARSYWIETAVAVAACVLFFVLLADSFRYVDKRLGPRLQQLEQQGPQ